MPNPMTSLDDLELGYDIPARIGMTLQEVQTPCLVVDLQAMLSNIHQMQARANMLGVKLRAHSKTHKSVDMAKLQIAAGASGICCQKLSEAAVFLRAGIEDVLITNQICDPSKIALLAQLARTHKSLAVCVDDAQNITDLSAAMQAAGSQLTVLVEMDCGGGRCGVAPGSAVVALALLIEAAPGLRFGGLQAYNGGAQHIYEQSARKTELERSHALLAMTLSALQEAGIACPLVTGVGTGSWDIEGASGLYTELQCGSYLLMDADYARVEAIDGQDGGGFEHALFVLSAIMSKARSGSAVCDAGLKAMSADSGMPAIFNAPDLAYWRYSDEHGEIKDPQDRLRIGDRLQLIPGHIDPTCNLHDWYVVLSEGRVCDLWPVSARGKLW